MRVCGRKMRKFRNGKERVLREKWQNSEIEMEVF